MVIFCKGKYIIFKPTQCLSENGSQVREREREGREGGEGGEGEREREKERERERERERRVDYFNMINQNL